MARDPLGRPGPPARTDALVVPSPLDLGARVGRGPGPAARAASPVLGEPASPRAGLVGSLDELAELAHELTVRIREARSTSRSRCVADDQLEALRLVTDHRKRVRAVRRVWEGLAPEEDATAQLISMTTLCHEESEDVHALVCAVLRRRMRPVQG